MKNAAHIILFLLIPVFAAHAQIDLPEALRNPIDHALQKSVTIKNKNLDVEKVQIERKAVLNKYVPTVEAMGGYAYFNTQVTVDVPTMTLPITGMELFDGKSSFDNSGNALHGGIMAKTVLFSGMQIPNGARALEQKAFGDSLLIETDKDKVIADVVESFDALILIYATQRLIDDSDKRLKKEEERVSRGIENGLAVPFDRDKIKLARLDLESKQVELDETRKVLIRKIHYLTGLTPAEIEMVSYQLEPLNLPENITSENKQELAALEAYKSASEYLIKKEKGSYLPTVGAFAGVSYTNLFNVRMDNFSKWPLPAQQPALQLDQFSAFPTLTAGVVMKWQIFGGFERKNKVKAATIDVQQLQNKIDDSKEQLDLLLEHKKAGYNTQWKKIEIVKQQKVIAQNNLLLAEKQYAQGLISISERLEAENDHYMAEQKNTQVLIDQRQSAMETLQVTGRVYDQINFR